MTITEKKYLFLISFLINSVIATSQTPYLSWAKQFGTENVNTSYGYSTVIDENGNLYSTGMFQSTGDFNPGSGTYNLTSNGGWDIYITKLDSAGNFIWAKQLGGTGGEECYSIELDQLGNVCVTGSFTNTADFDPGNGTYNFTSFGLYDVFVVKLNPSGDFMWAKQIGGAGYDASNDLAIDDNGNVFITGIIGNVVADFDPGIGIYNLDAANGRIFISKLNSSGDFIWAKQCGDEVATGQSIDVDSWGNIYTTGGFYNSSDFDPGNGVFTLNANGDYEIFILKLNSFGNFIWAKKMGGIDGNGDMGESLKLDSIGNVYTTGIFRSTVDFDPGVGIYNLSAGNDGNIFVSKLDSSGTFVWAKAFVGNGTGYGRTINIDTYSNIYIAGEFLSTTDFDPGIGVYNLNGTTDVFIVKLDPLGDFLWAVKAVGGNSSYYCFSIVVDNKKNVYTTGRISGTADFDPGSGIYNLSGSTAYLQKLCQSPLGAGTIIGEDTICPGQTGIIYTTIAIDGASGYNWDLPEGANIISGGNTNSIVVNFDWQAENGNITVRGVNDCGSGPPSENFILTVIPLPIIEPSDTTAFCEGGSVEIISNHEINNEWNTGDTTMSIIATESGIYFTEVDYFGCALISDTIEVTVFPTPATPTITQVGADLVSSFANSYFWFYNNNLISGATLQNYTPTQNGNYFVLVMDTNGCIASSDTIIVTNIGIGEINESDFISVYPNPTTGLFSVKLNGVVNKYEIQITDIFGKQILKKKEKGMITNIDISDYSQGVYFLRIISDIDKLPHHCKVEKL